VRFLFLPFSEGEIWDTTAGVAVVAFGIEDTALCSGLVQIIFKRQTSTGREPKE
jgi:hypothetical protein